MANPIEILVVVGTRPEAIKLAPVIGALRRDGRFRPLVLTTGQHREMVDDMLRCFAIDSDIDLPITTGSDTLTQLMSRLLRQVGEVLEHRPPAAVIVQGDTTSALAGALAAFYQRIPVIHVEAGLRTGDRMSPFPEEVNRRAISTMASLHLTPTESARRNLLAEGHPASDIRVTGNTVIDALQATVAARPQLSPDDVELIGSLENTSDRVLLVTAHRRESWDSGLAGIAQAVRAVVDRIPDLQVVFPIHRNPVVRAAMMPVLQAHPRITVIEPVAYPTMVRLLSRADLVLTDSGGIQEEAVTLGKPTLVARRTTERPEGVQAGGIALVGTDPDQVAERVIELLVDPASYQRLVCTRMPFGDGSAALRTVAAIAELLGVGGSFADESSMVPTVLTGSSV